jgi:hypothetical protein
VVRTQIQLEEHQIAELREIASASGQSIADLVRQAVDRLLASHYSISREERIERAKRAAGRFHSGLKDVSENHDKYFVEAIEDRLR